MVAVNRRVRGRGGHDGETRAVNGGNIDAGGGGCPLALTWRGHAYGIGYATAVPSPVQGSLPFPSRPFLRPLELCLLHRT